MAAENDVLKILLITYVSAKCVLKNDAKHVFSLGLVWFGLVFLV